MPRGNGPVTKVHYKGQDDDFVVLVESEKAVEDWKKDSSIPLADVVDGFKIFVTHKQGAQGVLDGASNQMLDSEFGTHNEDEVIKQILQKGEAQSTEISGRQGDTNLTMGDRVSHN